MHLKAVSDVAVANRLADHPQFPRSGSRSLPGISLGALSIWILLLGMNLLTGGRWEFLGPLGGEVRTLARDPANPEIIFAGSATSGRFKGAEPGSGSGTD